MSLLIIVLIMATSVLILSESHNKRWRKVDNDGAWSEYWTEDGNDIQH